MAKFNKNDTLLGNKDQSMFHLKWWFILVYIAWGTLPRYRPITKKSSISSACVLDEEQSKTTFAPNHARLKCSCSSNIPFKKKEHVTYIRYICKIISHSMILLLYINIIKKNININSSTHLYHPHPSLSITRKAPQQELQDLVTLAAVNGTT